MKYLCATCQKWVECRHAFGKFHRHRSNGGVGCDLLFDVPSDWLSPEQYEADRVAFAEEREAKSRPAAAIPAAAPRTKPALDVFARLSRLKHISK